MGKQGFRDISSDPFVYLESVSGESVALGIDDTDDNFKINVSAIAGANPSGTATLDIDTATNNTILSCGTLDIDATGALQINSSGGVISIGNDAVAQNINIGTGAAARTITMGNGTGITAVTVNVGTGILSLGTNATDHTTRLGSVTGTSATAIQSGTGALSITSTNGALTINSGTGALSISNDAANTTVTIATGAGVKTTTLGSTNTTSVTTVACGTGGASFGASANAHTTTLGSATGTSTTTVDCGTGGLNLGTSASVHTTTMGSNTGASSTIIRAGTGALTVTTLNGPLTIDSNNGTVTLDSGSGALNISTDPAATTVNIGTGGATKTINLGTGASPRVITIGSTDTTSSVDINIGTGDFDITSASGLLTRQLDTGEMTRPLQPAFFAQLASDDANVTGAGATYLLGTNVAFTEIFDQGGDFNTNGVFTAPVTGRYMFSGAVRTLGTIGTSGFFTCVTSNRVVLFYDINPAAVADAGASTQYVGSVLCDMDSGDTAQLRIQITGGAGNTVDLDGIATDAHTFFSGFLAC